MGKGSEKLKEQRVQSSDERNKVEVWGTTKSLDGQIVKKLRGAGRRSQNSREAGPWREALTGGLILLVAETQHYEQRNSMSGGYTLE